jgi:hypothetical protein
MNNNNFVKTYLSMFDNVITEADSSTNQSPALNKKISFEVKQYKLNSIKEADVKDKIKKICKEIGDNLKTDLNSFGTIGKFINDESNMFKSRIDELNEALAELGYFDPIDDDEETEQNSDENENSNDNLNEQEQSENHETTNPDSEDKKGETETSEKSKTGDVEVNVQEKTD